MAQLVPGTVYWHLFDASRKGFGTRVQGYSPKKKEYHKMRDPTTWECIHTQTGQELDEPRERERERDEMFLMKGCSRPISRTQMGTGVWAID